MRGWRRWCRAPQRPTGGPQGWQTATGPRTRRSSACPAVARCSQELCCSPVHAAAHLLLTYILSSSGKQQDSDAAAQEPGRRQSVTFATVNEEAEASGGFGHEALVEWPEQEPLPPTPPDRYNSEGIYPRDGFTLHPVPPLALQYLRCRCGPCHSDAWTDMLLPWRQCSFASLQAWRVPGYRPHAVV